MGLLERVSPCMRAKDPLSGLQQQTGKNPQFNITIKNAAYRLLVSLAFTGKGLDTILQNSYSVAYPWPKYRIAITRRHMLNVASALCVLF